MTSLKFIGVRCKSDFVAEQESGRKMTGSQREIGLSDCKIDNLHLRKPSLEGREL
jgi:hypothetical protein